LFIIRKLKWDRNEKDFLHFLKLLPEEGIALDVGANLGVMSYHLSRSFPRQKIYAFEPIPYNFNNLEKIRKRFKLHNLKIFQIALGEEAGELEMILPMERSVRFHGLAHVRENAARETEAGEIFHCPVERLDQFTPLKSEGKKITGIKIDVENFEYHVLKGAEGLLEEHKPLIYCELWDNENRRKTISFLENIGYKTLVLDKRELKLFDPVNHSTQNFFFLPKD
jgi:FkbM family methyltransferase